MGFFTLFLLNSVLLCFPISALSCQRSNGSESNNVLLRLLFHLPASKTSLRSQRTLLEMELHRLCAHTVCLSAFDSKSHNWLISPYSQTAFCAVLHEIQNAFFFVFFHLYKPKKRNEMKLTGIFLSNSHPQERGVSTIILLHKIRL